MLDPSIFFLNDIRRRGVTGHDHSSRLMAVRACCADSCSILGHA
jgi:hypothetical protein